MSKNLNDQVVPPNTDVQLSCVVPDGPEVKTQWFRDGKPIQVPSEKYEEFKIGNVSILVGKGAKVEDQGQFTCGTPYLQITTKRKLVINVYLEIMETESSHDISIWI